MKLKEGMYVRFKRYTGAVSIGQIFDVDIDKYNFCLTIDLGNSRLLFFDKENIVKYSFNLIDLIEVGDYINGLPVTFVYIPDGVKASYFLLGTYQKHFINEDIKSIVTKEQFDSVKYEVE